MTADTDIRPRAHPVGSHQDQRLGGGCDRQQHDLPGQHVGCGTRFSMCSTLECSTLECSGQGRGCLLRIP